jgi:hypothetical protein
MPHRVNAIFLSAILMAMSFHLLVGCSRKSHAREIRRRAFRSDLSFRKMESPLGSFQSKSFVPLGTSLEPPLEKRR